MQRNGKCKKTWHKGSLNALEEARNHATGDDEEFDEVWIEIQDDEMTWEGAQTWEDAENTWCEENELNASGNWDAWPEEEWQGGFYCVIPEVSVNDQLNQDKMLYMENFQKGGDNRIEGLEDVMFVLGNEKDVKRDEYKVVFINK